MSRDLSFDEALSRLEAIVGEVKQKEIPLEESLDLLEEGVRLANICTEKTDHIYWREKLEASD